MLKRLILLIAALALVVVGAAAPPVPAWAHGVSGESDVRFAQTFADLEITVVIRANTHVPAPLTIDVVAHAPEHDATVDLAVRPAAGGATESDSVRIEAGESGM